MTPQEQKELLLRVVVKVAAIQLENGGLFPFGATLGAKRDVKLLTPKSMKKNVSREELDEYWKRELRKSTGEDRRKTACWCADVRVPMDDGRLVPAVFINFEHADGSAEDILYPERMKARPLFSASRPAQKRHPRYSLPLPRKSLLRRSCVASHSYMYCCGPRR